MSRRQRGLARALACIPLLLAFTPLAARADSPAGAVAEVVVEAVVRGAIELAFDAVIPAPSPKYELVVEHIDVGEELADWIDPRTGTTSHLAHGCGQLVEVRLTGKHRDDFLNVTLFNTSSDPVAVTAHSKTIGGVHGELRQWGSHSVLAPHVGGPQIYVVRPSLIERSSGFVIDFDVSSLRTSQSCQLSVRFVRTGPVPASALTEHSYFQADYGVWIGAHLAGTGPLHGLAREVEQFDGLSFGYSPAAHHRIGLDVGLDIFAAGESAGVSLVPNYEYRAFLSRTVSYGIGGGAGPYLIALRDAPDHWTWALRGKLELRWHPGRSSGLEFGPALTCSVLPGGPFGPNRYSGELVAAQLGLWATF